MANPFGLIGRIITNVRAASKAERDYLGWTESTIVIELDNGEILLYPTRDEELNGPAPLLIEKEHKLYSLSPEELQ